MLQQHTVDFCCACCPPGPLGPFQQGCSPIPHIIACTGLFGYVIPGAGLHPCLYFLLALCKMSLSFDMSTSLLSLASAEDLVRVLSILSSRSVCRHITNFICIFSQIQVTLIPPPLTYAISLPRFTAFSSWLQCQSSVLDCFSLEEFFILL